MMMNLMKRKNKDWQIVSEYLDGHLSAKELKSFEERVQIDSDLLDIVEKAKWTKTLLKQAPRRSVPHQFVLTRQMANEIQHRQRGLVWRYGLVSGMASLIFLVLAGFQLLPMVGMSTDLAMAPKESVMEEMSMAADSAESEIAMYDEVVVEETEIEAAPMMMQEAPVEEESTEVQTEAFGAVEEEEVEAPLMKTEEETMDEAASEAEEAPAEPAGGGGLPPTLTPVPTIQATALPEGVENAADDSQEVPETQLDESLPAAEDSDVNSEPTVERMTPEEMITIEPDYPGRIQSGIIVYGVMVLSAIVAFAALLAAFRAKNRY